MIVVAWKWVSTGDDGPWAEASEAAEADRAALEIGLRLAEQHSDAVTVVTVGPPEAERALREALAAGASRAVRVDAPGGTSSDSVAAAIATVAGDADWVVCGDASPDRGSGSVPAFLAAELGAAQALGLIEVVLGGRGVRAVRRLDGGRREVLDVTPPAVLSVEGSVARLRRASLPAELAARAATVEQLSGPGGPVDEPDVVAPYRPRARALSVPAGDALQRVRALTDVGGDPAGHVELVTLDPPAAAIHILATLRAWGYLPSEERN